jgi:hypothetical protein
VEEKVQPQKPPKPRRQVQKTQKDPEAPVDPGACGTGSKTPGGIPASSKAKLTVLLRKEGFTVSSSTVGRILRYLKTRGLLREGEKPRKVSATKSPRGNQRPRVMRKPKDYEVESPKDLIAIDTSGVVPFLERCISNSPPETLSPGGPIPPSI